ncbi:MAG: peptidylprolyl isomerase [Methanoregula sp.]|jgi:peptidylprolyl isomerase
MIHGHAIIHAGLLVLILMLVSGCTQTTAGSAGAGNTGSMITQATMTPVETQAANTSSWQKVRLETTMGNITIALDPDMPITAGNFANLTRIGYYDGVIFHRVKPGFMIQGGDPSGTSYGNPGYFIPDEFTDHNQNNRGTVAMANAGANTGGSQFFINVVNNNYLDAKHPVFGTVVDGMDVADAIANVPRDENNRPLTNVTILHAEII